MLRAGAKVGAFRRGVRRRVTYTDGDRTLFPIDLDLTEDTQARYYLRFPDPALRDLILAGSGTFVDIGANVGIFTLLGSCPFERVVAFEPLPTVRRTLEAGCAGRGKIEVRREALSDREGTATLHQNAVGLGGSSIEAIPAHLRRITRRNAWVDFDVPLARLDALAAGWDRIDLVKIDVEGHEPAVVAGAVETLRRHRPVVYVETHDDRRFEDLRRLLPPGHLVLDPMRRRLTDARPPPDSVFFRPERDGLVRRAFPGLR